MVESGKSPSDRPVRVRRRANAAGSAEGARIDQEEAILLRMTPVTESSCMAFWLTRQGALTTLVKGGYRRRSPFLGHLDLFRTCELLYYPSRRADRPAIAREITVLSARNEFRSRWRAAAAASYLCDLSGRVFLEPATSPAGYDRLTRALDALQAGRGPGSVILWFELQIAAMLGWMPRLDSCSICGKKAQDGVGGFFVPSLGSLVCSACRPGRTLDGDFFKASTRRRLNLWQETEDPEQLPDIRIPRSEARLLQRGIGRFLQFHLNLNPAARDLAFDCLFAQR